MASGADRWLLLHPDSKRQPRRPPLIGVVVGQVRGRNHEEQYCSCSVKQMVAAFASLRPLHRQTSALQIRQLAQGSNRLSADRPGDLGGG